MDRMKDRLRGKNPILQEGANGAAYGREDPSTYAIITGATGDQVVAGGVAVEVTLIRVGGIANLVGAAQIKDGGTVVETFAAASVPSTERRYAPTIFTSLKINLASAGDTIVVFYRLA